MTAVLLKAMRDLRRRRLQAAVIFVTTLLAVATGAMALTLISQPSDPYKAAFDAQKGAHLQVGFNGEIDLATLATTPSLIGASAFGGPYPATALQFQSGSHKYALTLFGRDDPNGDVEQLRVSAGRWPATDSEIALA
ncbi:MAG TPA: ABC transporter permease, partial [Candidatus Dormibacteraeota bacterium]|nr:ABC transporter permease [Candidatus Dormibacteraeota bacterium]